MEAITPEESCYWRVIDKYRKVTWEKIAKEVGMSISGIYSAMENGRTLNLEKTWIISRMLDLKLDEFSDYRHFICFHPHHEDYAGNGSFADRFWDTVNLIRKQKEISWAKLGRFSGIPASTISTARTYKRVISFDLASKIVNIGLGCSLDVVVNMMYNDDIRNMEEQKEIAELTAMIMKLSHSDRILVKDLVMKMIRK